MPKYINIDGHLQVIKDDELYHWKYLYKKKVNGKWRYYYGNPTLKDRVKSKLGYAEKDFADLALAKYKKARENVTYYQQQLKGTTTPNRQSSLKNDMKFTKSVRDHEFGKYKQALNDYEKTPLYKVRSARKKAIAKGKSFAESVSGKIKKVGKKTKSTVAKGKNFVDSITKKNKKTYTGTKKNGSIMDISVSNVSPKRRTRKQKTYTGTKKNRLTMDIGMSNVSSMR